VAIRGWVYVIANQALPGLLKIGFSTKDPALRALELDSTGVPHPYVVVYDALVREPRDIEQRVHTELKSQCVGKSGSAVPAMRQCRQSVV
jgi:T5orf172 domain